MSVIEGLEGDPKKAASMESLNDFENSIDEKLPVISGTSHWKQGDSMRTPLILFSYISGECTQSSSRMPMPLVDEVLPTSGAKRRLRNTAKLSF